MTDELDDQLRAGFDALAQEAGAPPPLPDLTVPAAAVEPRRTCRSATSAMPSTP